MIQDVHSFFFAKVELILIVYRVLTGHCLLRSPVFFKTLGASVRYSRT